MISISSECMKKATEIYKGLQDEESKEIFLNKLLYCITWQDKYWHDILKYRNKEVFTQLSDLSKETNEIIIYGAGAYCEPVLRMCEGEGCCISYICDKDAAKQGKKINDIMVISPEELIKEHKAAIVIISSLRYSEEIQLYLLNYFPKNQIIPFAGNGLLEFVDNQYFAEDIMKFEDGEVFVDGGCFDFETSKFLLQRCKVKHIYAFEPDKNNLIKVEGGIKETGFDNVTVFNKGLWDKEDKLYFNASGDILSHVTSSGSNEDMIEVVALDEVIDEKVTFIKMDIEGSELKALEGAKNLICTYKPKLAICIYHKPEDTIDIPAYIKSLVPEYRFWIRHYSYSPAETVLYATL